MSAAIVEALAGEATVVVADATTDASDVLVALRSPRPENAVLILIRSDFAPVDRAMILAALGPLAIEFAPVRIVALDVTDDAPFERIVDSARYLTSARSITGQSLELR